jgi:hypothetical protein
VESWTPVPRVARVEAWVPRRGWPKSWAPRGARRKSARHPTMGPRGGGGQTASLCSWGGLAAWARGLTFNLCSKRGRTVQKRGLTASNG